MAPGDIGDDDLCIAAAADERRIVEHEGPRCDLLAGAQSAVDIELYSGCTRGFAAEKSGRVGDEGGLQSEMASDLHASKAQRRVGGADHGCVADAIAQSPRGIVDGPARFEACDGVVADADPARLNEAPAAERGSFGDT